MLALFRPIVTSLLPSAASPPSILTYRPSCRAQKGQLGHGDLVNRNMPKLVEGLAGKFVVAAAAGRFHSVVVTKDGESYAFGSNQLVRGGALWVTLMGVRPRRPGMIG